MALLDEGDYVGTIKAGWDVTTTSKGKPQLTLPVRLTHILDDETGEKKELSQPINRDVNMMLDPDQIGNTIKNLRFLGYNRKDARGLNPRADSAFDFKGIVIGVKVTHREYKGRDTESAWFSRKGVEQSEASRNEVFRSIDELFSSAVQDLDSPEDVIPETDTDSGDTETGDSSY